MKKILGTALGYLLCTNIATGAPLGQVFRQSTNHASAKLTKTGATSNCPNLVGDWVGICKSISGDEAPETSAMSMKVEQTGCAYVYFDGYELAVGAAKTSVIQDIPNDTAGVFYTPSTTVERFEWNQTGDGLAFTVNDVFQGDEGQGSHGYYANGHVTRTGDNLAFAFKVGANFEMDCQLNLK